MNKIKSKVNFRQFRLTLLFSFAVFLILMITMTLFFIITCLLAYLNVIDRWNTESFPLLRFCVVSTLMGTVLSAIFGWRPLRSIQELMTATDKIADGDYSVRLYLKGPEDFQILSDKFNHMAKELESVEMLRNDFVNNFSHEFKTPIVSIRGFARALKRNDLTSEERSEYLDIIIAESERLTDLSANVLYLSKLENQQILTDCTPFNVTEQIRLVIALLDSEIEEKELQILFDNEECFMNANKEMMRQVWINLMNNAIKFSPNGSTIEIQIQQIETSVTVSISNEAKTFSPELSKHLFDKFYQGDSSHSVPGNGLGLSIVKKIIDLHHGDITVCSANDLCTFRITV